MMAHWLTSLPPLLLVGFLAWIYAYRRDNVNVVDSLWSLFFLLATLTYAVGADQLRVTGWLLLCLVGIWSLRLSAHLAIRNAGKPEDRRYASMRAHNPRFATQSLITVFGLQAALAWFISLPLAVALENPPGFGPLHLLALLLFAIGFFFEAMGDWQLTRFKRSPDNQGKVLDTGLWAISRHPNYFGEACIWWSFVLFALAAGSLWSIVSPLLMTFLLLKVSGVSLLERDISDRRPAYRRYIERTPAFVPWLPKSPAKTASHSEGSQ